jgi:hypothetical protein
MQNVYKSDWRKAHDELVGQVEGGRRMSEKAEKREVSVGDIWVDRDPRSWSGNRRVKVMSITTGVPARVHYRQVVGNSLSTRAFRSDYERFQRAFRLLKAGSPQP